MHEWNGHGVPSRKSILKIHRLQRQRVKSRLNRRKREAEKSGGISEDMINEMIDLMNKLNENFGEFKR